MRFFRPLIVILLCLGGFIVILASILGGPLPPPRLVMGGAMKAGTLNAYMNKYQEILQSHGIKVDLPEMLGTRANLEALRNPASDVMAGLTTTGTYNFEDEKRLASLGGLFYVPYFIVSRHDLPYENLSDLKGRRISVGTPGYYSTQLARRLLKLAGVDETNSTLLEIDWLNILDALDKGTVDAGFLVGFIDKPEIRAALANPKLKFLSIREAEAISKLMPELHPIALPRGFLDMTRPYPKEDVIAVANVVGLTVRHELHPAIQHLLLQAATEIHGPAGVFNRLDEFPKRVAGDLPLTEEAARFYRTGPSWLKNYVGFWAAVYLERALTLALPLVVILGPAARFGPWVFCAYYRRRIRSWNRRLTDLSKRLNSGADPTEVADRARALFQEIESRRFPPQLRDETTPVFSEVQKLRAQLESAPSRDNDSDPPDAAIRAS